MNGTHLSESANNEAVSSIKPDTPDRLFTHSALSYINGKSRTHALLLLSAAALRAGTRKASRCCSLDRHTQKKRHGTRKIRKRKEWGLEDSKETG